jgi:hypothetical protein
MTASADVFTTRQVVCSHSQILAWRCSGSTGEGLMQLLNANTAKADVRRW